MPKKSMMLVMDHNHRILYRNNEFKMHYPDINMNVCCYQAITENARICHACPIHLQNRERVFYDSSREEWIDFHIAETDWDGNENCFVMLARVRKPSDDTVTPDERNEFNRIIELQSKLLAREAELKVKQDEIQHRQALVHALSQDYSNVYYIDTDADTFDIYRVDEYLHDAIADIIHATNTYSTTIERCIKAVVYPPDQRDMLDILTLSSIRSELSDKPSFTYIYRVEDNGNLIYFQIKCVRVELGEKGCKAILGFRDISSEVREDKKQQQILRDALAQAEYANRAKTVFLNNMSHDIRTPMNAIIGYTALASNHLDDKEHLKDYLSKISQSSNHLLSLINDVLDMSRIESGKMRLDEQPENILELIQSIRNIIQTDINTRKLELSIDMAEISDENIYCDKLKLNQILLNLLSNAMKFSKQGGTVYLKIRQNEDAPNGYGAYEFRVKDNGIGMSREFQAHIFEPFTREHTSTVTGIQGTGLGMSITKNIVDMMGGTISVTSERGKGTEFVVKLNLKLKNTPGDSGSESCSNTDKTSDDSVTDFTGTRILLAEDNELNTEIAIELLSEYGFVIETAPNGRIACDKLATSKPGYYDLILMDIQMPIMDGYEAAVNIRAMKEKKFSCIPIIAMTANAFAEDRDKALKCGMNAHVAKPINMKNLLKTIQQVLKSADYN